MLMGRPLSRLGESVYLGLPLPFSYLLLQILTRPFCIGLDGTATVQPLAESTCDQMCTAWAEVLWQGLARQGC